MRTNKVITIKFRLGEESLKRILQSNETADGAGQYVIEGKMAEQIVKQARKEFPEMVDTLTQLNMAEKIAREVHTLRLVDNPAREKKRTELNEREAALWKEFAILHKEDDTERAKILNEKLQKAGITLWKSNNGYNIVPTSEEKQS